MFLVNPFSFPSEQPLSSKEVANKKYIKSLQFASILESDSKMITVLKFFFERIKSNEFERELLEIFKDMFPRNPTQLAFNRFKFFR